MDRQGMLDYLLKDKRERFDEEEGMVARNLENAGAGYHTRRLGKTHDIKENTGYAAALFLAEQEQEYDRAIKILHRVCDVQDTRKDSKTFGLWSYYLEEDLDHMIAPDYNWANFVGRDLLAICILCKDKLPQDLERNLHQAIRNAAECTVRRNVAADYTNISIMGSLTIIAAGELLQDERLFNIGKERLRKLYEYTKVTTAFSEYNSSAYVVIALQEIARMLVFFKDEECRFMAQELNRYGWAMLASHYNISIGQLTPPQMRSYKDVDNGTLAWIVWDGTDGKYGYPLQTNASPKDVVDIDSLLYVVPKCPQECFELFEKKEAFLAHTFYRQNTIRQCGEDTTIIRELDSPDLTAYSYKTPYYSMGAFALCDCWNQRRNVMVVWDKEQPKTFRLRGIHNGYDFCSGMAYTQQDKGQILGHLGLVTDRGSFHYILDKDKSGVYDVQELSFRFELGGNTEGIFIEQVDKEGPGRDFIISDGPMFIRLHIEKWVFDGQEREVRLSEDGKAVVLVGYEGPSKRVDTNKLGDTYGVFTLNVEHREDETNNMSAYKEKEIQTKVLSGGRLETSWSGMKVESYISPVTYRKALGLESLDYDKMNDQIQMILEKMKGMEADGTVEETCPISIISMDAWEWPQGVALFAMYQYYRESGDRAVLEYLKNWFDRQIAKGLPSQNINTTCPMLTLACIYEEERDEKYLPLLQQWLEGVMHRLPRTPEGGLQHIVSGILNEGQLWDDTLYMTVLFLARMGRVLGREDYIQESIRQFMVHIKYLSDVKTGLFFHGWTFNGNHHFAEALWGRGNSWYTAGLVDYLECLEGNEGVKQFLLTTLLRQVEALEACQDEGGLWHTILDDSDSYLETSASCAFAYGILKAVRKGYLPARFALVGEKAVKGVMSQIDEDGTVNGVSYGTPVFHTVQEYKDIPICPMPYGQSMALMMLVEAYRNKL